MNHLAKLFLLLPLLVLPACATIFGNSSDTITIHSTEPDAKLALNGNPVGTGNATYTLPRGKSAVITASKPGCSDMSQQTDTSFVNAGWLNILFWPGFIIDAITGKMFEADPKNYTVSPNCPR